MMVFPTRVAVSGIATVVMAMSVNVSQAGAAPLQCEGMRATIVGTPRGDVIRGTVGRDVIVALDGNDTIHALAGEDVVCAGHGNDRVRGGTGRDSVTGGAGADVIYGEAGRDGLLGGANDDRVLGGTGSDAVYGGSGDDLLRGGDGVDFLAGSFGHDRLFGDAGDDSLLDEENEEDALDGGVGVDRCDTADVPRNCEPLLVGGTLAPGGYELAKFTPAFRFEVHERGWRTDNGERPSVFALAWYIGRERTPTVGRLIFQRHPAQVLDPASGRLEVAPDDLLAWLTAHPCLVPIGPISPGSVGGVTGLSADFTVGPCHVEYLWPYLRCKRADTCFDALSVSEGDLLRITTISLGSTRLLVLQTFDLETASAHQEAFRSDTAQLLDSVHFLQLPPSRDPSGIDLQPASYSEASGLKP
jgi:Ca2+-binding RTX toxin-like protein